MALFTPTTRKVRFGVSALLVLWGALWLWFAGAHLFGPETDRSLIHFVAFGIPLAALVALGIALPRSGGLALVAGSAFSYWFFSGAAAALLLSTPALLLGAALIWVGPWSRLNRPQNDPHQQQEQEADRAPPRSGDSA